MFLCFFLCLIVRFQNGGGAWKLFSFAWSCLLISFISILFLFAGVSGTFSPISAASFSPIRPLVFAATSSDGFVYLYDLGANPLSPVASLECPLLPPVSAEDTAKEAARGASVSTKHKPVAHKKASGGDAAHNRVTVTGLAFNPKQRGLIAACDYLGRVHIWKLSWKLSNIKADEQSTLDAIASIYSSDD